MKPCPHCAKDIADDAHRCAHCGRAVDGGEPIPIAHEPGPRELERLAEIRRLQRVASGIPTRQDRTRMAKGLMALLIMIMLAAYAYIWKEARSAELANTAPVSYAVFNAAFGDASPLSPATREEEFQRYRGLRVVWEGTVVYVNQGSRGELYVSLRHRSDSPTSDVLLRFRESDRDQLNHLPVGTRVRYGGRLHEYGAGGSGFITLKDGVILERLDASNSPPGSN